MTFKTGAVSFLPMCTNTPRQTHQRSWRLLDQSSQNFYQT